MPVPRINLVHVIAQNGCKSDQDYEEQNNLDDILYTHIAGCYFKCEKKEICIMVMDEKRFF